METTATHHAELHRDDEASKIGMWLLYSLKFCLSEACLLFIPYTGSEILSPFI